MIIENIEIGQGQPCRFVAEISNNHGGDFARALRLITAAKESGADLVKFQCFDPSELIALRGNGPAPEPWGGQGWTMETLYQKARTPFEWFPDLFQYVRDMEMVPFSSVFGHESLEVLESVKCPVYKVAKLDNRHSWLVYAALKTGKPVIVSAEKRADHNVMAGVHNLYCPGTYDGCSPEDMHLPRSFSESGYLGLSSHCIDSALGPVAVALGAKMLEYHFQLSDEPSELEEAISLYPCDFREMVDSVRATEAMLA